MTRTAPTAQEQIVDDLLRRVEEAWVDDEFSAIVAANWPAEPPEPPPTAGRGSADPPLPASPALLGPRARSTATRVRPSLRRRQRSPPPVTASVTEH